MSSDQLDRDTEEIVAAVKDELADERFLGDKVLVSRRELVGVAAGSASVAALLGHETGTASAQSSGTGRLGDPTPLEYVGTGSLDTGALWNDTDILVMGPSGQLIDRRDPSSSTTPVQDAIGAASSAGGGEVYLPARTIDDSGPIQPATGVDVYGRGYGGTNATVVNITGGGAGIQVPSGGASYGSLMEFRVTNGSGLGNDTGAGFKISNQFRQFDVSLRFDDWTGNVLDVTGGSMFENRFHRLQFQNCDAGNGNALMSITSCGPANWMGTIAAYPTDTNSAAGSNILYSDTTKGEVLIEFMNVGGTPMWAVDRRDLEYLQINAINYEGNPPTTPSRIVYNGRARRLRVNYVRNTNTVDNVYFLNTGDCYLGEVENTGTVNNAMVKANTDIAANTVYEGASADVSNDSGGTLTTPIACLADLTKVS